MKHRASSRFWSAYEKLPAEVQQLADDCYQRLKADPTHPSLHFKKVGRYWSSRVGLHYRALAIQEASDLVWFWIGRHDAYARLLGRA